MCVNWTNGSDIALKASLRKSLILLIDKYSYDMQVQVL